jgi:hypothetical protein
MVLIMILIIVLEAATALAAFALCVATPRRRRGRHRRASAVVTVIGLAAATALVLLLSAVTIHPQSPWWVDVTNNDCDDRLLLVELVGSSRDGCALRDVQQESGPTGRKGFTDEV